MVNYNTWSLQRVFNKVAKHLLTQNSRATKSDHLEECTLFDEETGKRCAVGCLLPKSYYKKEFSEGERWRRIREIIIPNSKLDLLMDDLMECHDDIKPSRWPQRLRAIARDKGLEIPEFLRNGK